MNSLSSEIFWYDTVEQKWKPKCKFCLSGLSYGCRISSCPKECKGDSK